MKNSLLYTICLCFSILQGAASTCSAAQVHSDKTAPKVTLDYPSGRVTYFQPFRGTVSDSGGSGVAKIIVRITRIDERKRRWQWDGDFWWQGRPAIDFCQEDWRVEAKIKGTQWVFDYVPTRLALLSGHGPARGPELHSGLYLIKVIAYDRANNSRALLRRVRVNADITSPRVIVESPRLGQKSLTFPAIKGQVYDRGGSGIESVKVTIYTDFPDKYSRLGQAWNGDRWAEVGGGELQNRSLTAQVKGNRWWLSRPPTSKGLLPGRYAVVVHAYDRAGNRNGLKSVLKRVNWSGSKTNVKKIPEVTDTVRPIYITIQ